MPVNKNNIDVDRKDCAITVTLRVEFKKAGKLGSTQNFQNLIRNWTTHTENVLNGPRGRKWKCCSVRFHIVSRVGEGTPKYHQVNVENGPGTWNGGKSFTDGAAGTGQSNQTDWAMITAHEIGHALGLSDEYHYDDGKYVNDNPQPAVQPQSVMAQTWGAVAFLQAHIDKIMEAVGAICPPECCPPPADNHVAPPPKVEERKPKLDGWEVRTMPIDQIIKVAGDGEIVDLEIARREIVRQFHSARVEILAHLADPLAIRRWLIHAAAREVAGLETPAIEAGLRDRCETIRLMCAYDLARGGNKRALMVLTDATGSSTPLISHPPMRACDFAYAALDRLTGVSFGVDEFGDRVRRSAIGRAWKIWYRANSAAFASKSRELDKK